MGGYRAAPQVDKTTYQKYDTPAPIMLNYYVLFQYTLCLAATALFLFNAARFSLGEKAIITVLISLTVVNCGVLFENRKWVVWSEWLRIILYPALLIGLTYLLNLPAWYYVIGISYFFISFTWFYVVTKKHAAAQLA
jgi:hypothetical protein